MAILRASLLLVVLAAAAYSNEILELDNPDRIPDRFVAMVELPQKVPKLAFANGIVEQIGKLVKSLKMDAPLVFNKHIILTFSSRNLLEVQKLFRIPQLKFLSADVEDQKLDCQTQQPDERLWGLARTSSNEMPNYKTTGYSYNSGAKDVTVYVIDTGINVQHNDFEGRATHGYTVAGLRNEGDRDMNGHGTHCAGTVMGKSYGVSKTAKAIAVKVVGSSGRTSRSNLAEGARFVLNDFQGKRAMNSDYRALVSVSIGGGASIFTDSIYEELVDAGIPVVNSAGNSDRNACSYSPARSPKVITVGATNKNDGLAWFSNWGSCVNILAPGQDIFSASRFGTTGGIPNSGTSMACPHVAGAIARRMSEVQKIPTLEEIRAWLSNTSTKNAIYTRNKSVINELLFNAC